MTESTKPFQTKKKRSLTIPTPFHDCTFVVPLEEKDSTKDDVKVSKRYVFFFNIACDPARISSYQIENLYND